MTFTILVQPLFWWHSFTNIKTFKNTDLPININTHLLTYTISCFLESYYIIRLEVYILNVCLSVTFAAITAFVQ